MHHNIIKDTVNLDKEAREKVQELKKEKDNLGKTIKEEAANLQKQFNNEIKQTIKKTKVSLENEVHMMQSSELLSYEKTLTEIQKQYEENKETWIEEIYKECVK